MPASIRVRVRSLYVCPPVGPGKATLQGIPGRIAERLWLRE
jgi:hypothetical protein